MRPVVQVIGCLLTGLLHQIAEGCAMDHRCPRQYCPVSGRYFRLDDACLSLIAFYPAVTHVAVGFLLFAHSHRVPDWQVGVCTTAD
ncbi:hypothetical protein Acife_1032 [Acidithiobacillus ferrivorans SS3]|jgi:hypothetical protein|uniref:Uncharacterized protein n=1 Tax=Acidithiobacillus ferrivorans SS3 TaxID=743299 RepID=G0JNH1_9PROT|nr:hypothetical protein [Acidithiobacillus ferrivorans]AEM47201.1 hypothetical protein Acife_1032 [Acidithiobacillus ferrivorans SS3]